LCSELHLFRIKSSFYLQQLKRREENWGKKVIKNKYG